MFLKLEDELGRVPKFNEVNKAYGLKLSKEEYQDYLEEKWVWKIKGKNIKIPSGYLKNSSNIRRAVRSVYTKYFINSGQKLRASFFKEEGLNSLIFNAFAGSPYNALIECCSDFPVVRDSIWKVIPQVPNGFWDKEENQERIKRAVRKVFVKNYACLGKQITLPIFSKEGLGSLLYNKFKGSPSAALLEYCSDFPVVRDSIWKVVASVPNGFWDKEENQERIKRAVRKVFVKYHKCLGKKLSNSVFKKEGLNGLLATRFKNSPYDLLMEYCGDFDDVKESIWKVIPQVPDGFWNIEDNVKKAVRWLFKELYIKRNKKISYDSFKREGLGGLINLKLKDSPSAALLEYCSDFPVVRDSIWKVIPQVPDGFWNIEDNVKKAVRMVYVKNFIEKGEQITVSAFKREGLLHLLNHNFNKSPYTALIECCSDYDDVKNNIWKVIPRVPDGFWNIEDNVKKAVRMVYVKNFIEKGEQITKSVFKREGLLNLLKHKFNSSPYQALIECCSDYDDVKNNIWKVISQVPDGFWRKEENQERIKRAVRKVFVKYHKCLGETIDISSFSKEGLRGLLDSNYNTSAYFALLDCCSDFDDIKKNIVGVVSRLPNGYWEKKENRIKKIKELSEQLKPREKITKKMFMKNGAAGLVSYSYKKDNIEGIKGLLKEYESFFTKTIEKNNLGEEINAMCKRKIDHIEKEDIKLPVLAALTKYLPRLKGKRKGDNDKPIVYRNQPIIKMEYTFDEKKWRVYNERINPNQFLNALIWGGIKKLSEEDKEAFMNEEVIGIKIGQILLDELAHSTTGIESLLINQRVNQEYAYLMPKISIGAGAGHDLLEGDVGIDLNPSSPNVIKANALTYDYTQHSSIHTISFPDSLHSLPINRLPAELRNFDNFIITLPFNGKRRDDLIQELVDEIGDKIESELGMKVRYTYLDGTTRDKPIIATILTPVEISEEVVQEMEKKINSLNRLRTEYPKEFNYIAHMINRMQNEGVVFDKYGNAITWAWATKWAKEILGG